MIRLYYPKFWDRKNFLSILLLPLSILYYICYLFRKLLANPIKMPCKTICVGNITVGGAGKTQVVIWLCKNLSKDNKVLVISKGYGGSYERCLLVNKESDVKIVGDEAKEISQYAEVIVTKKIRYALELVENIKPSVIIFDDWMQNPELLADDTILVVDGDRKFGNKFLMPAGPLREHPKCAKFDSIIVVGNKKEDVNLKDLQLPEKPVVYANITAKSKHDKSKEYFAFAGIGNFERFIESLKLYGLNVVGSKEFEDHHIYTDEDISSLKTISGVQLITTRKDFMKVDGRLNAEVFEVELNM